jgi:diguanylate cyclase (GGDEF)-like protein/PAS domain S-box-containing protein
MTIQNRRILLIDDMPSIHEDFRKILAGASDSSELDEAEAALFGIPLRKARVRFEIDSAYQGQDGLRMVRGALEAGRPYALAFVDMRMPPGWNGVETIERLWQEDPLLQIVICTAYSDAEWEEVLERLDVGDRLLILKKPFDAIEVFQLASTLTAKWRLSRQAALRMADLEAAIQERTEELSLAASVFHNTMDGVMITSAAGLIVSVNPAFSAITGYSAQEALGQKPNLLRSAHHRPEFYRELWAALLRDGRWEGEIWNRRKNGEAFLEWLSISMVAGTDGKPLRYVGVFNDITEIRRKDEHIRHLAFHDPLTGLPNRALLLDRLEHSLAMSARAGAGLGVLFVDLDRFKQINDSLGHDIGDGVLKEVAARLSACLRQSDTVARIGGDEFIILLERVEAPATYAGLTELIMTSLNAPMSVAGHPIQIGASIGIACYPEDGGDVASLMKQADAAMYVAKSAGRGIYRFFQPAMTERAGQRLQLEMALRGAAANGELELFYQPKVSLASGALAGVEALVRWHHPQLGLILPAEFIPIAEESRLIVELGNWVLEQACRQARAWREAGLSPIRIAVNVAARQFQDDDLVARIDALTGRYGITPASLEIELTESVVMANPQEIAAVLARLREAGATVAVDDFGTGYSSLAYLRRLPIDVLKIDRSFVLRADTDDGDAQVVQMIIALAQALKLAVVAEGVETESQAAFLKGCGCAIGQGYLYSPPQPARDITAWMRERKGFIASKDGGGEGQAAPMA